MTRTQLTDATPASPRAIRAAVEILIAYGDGPTLGVAAALLSWLDQPAGQSKDLDSMFALPWRRRLTECLRRRNELLVDIAHRRFPGLGCRSTARAMAATFRGYETTAWPRDRASGRRPDGLSGDLYDVLSLGGVPAERSLRAILTAGHSWTLSIDQQLDDYHRDEGNT
jgi:hypothetical protein